MNIDFCSPIDPEKIFDQNLFSGDDLYYRIKINGRDTPEAGEKSISLIGIVYNKKDDSPDLTRKYLYRLKKFPGIGEVNDLGNFLFKPEDPASHEKLAYLLGEIINAGSIPVIFGGNQEVTFSQYLAYEYLKRQVNIVNVDARIDFDLEESPILTNETFFQRMLVREPSYVFNLCHMGFQNYFVSDEVVDIMEKLFFDMYRLGQVRENIKNSEALFRHAEMVSFDLGAIRQSDAPGNNNPGPNGFYAEEACQLARFAGLSDKLNSIGFYEYNSGNDRDEQTANLLAQMIWHFMEGYFNREPEYPYEDTGSFFKYITTFREGDYQIVFYKSKMTDRWWMEVPTTEKQEKFREQYLIPCTYEDYLAATKNEIPERWWNALKKLL